MSTLKHTLKVGKAEITHSSWSKQITFTNEGVERRIEDPHGLVMELVEAIKKGSGKKVQANVTTDNAQTGFPPNNLRTVMGGEGRPQHPGGQFLGGGD